MFSSTQLRYLNVRSLIFDIFQCFYPISTWKSNIFHPQNHFNNKKIVYWPQIRIFLSNLIKCVLFSLVLLTVEWWDDNGKPKTFNRTAGNVHHCVKRHPKNNTARRQWVLTATSWSSIERNGKHRNLIKSKLLFSHSWNWVRSIKKGEKQGEDIKIEKTASNYPSAEIISAP